MNAYEWIEKIKEKHGLPSDYAAAKLLDIPTNQVSNYKSNRAPTMNDETALKVAILLDIAPLTVLSDQHGERAKTPEAKKEWKKIFETIGMQAVQPSLVIALLSINTVTEYILCKIEWLKDSQYGKTYLAQQ